MFYCTWRSRARAREKRGNDGEFLVEKGAHRSSAGAIDPINERYHTNATTAWLLGCLPAASYSQRDDDRPTSKQDSDFNPTYAGLPPREIIVEASVGCGGSTTTTPPSRTVALMSSKSSSVHEPDAPRRVDDPKTKIFTFEGLTPVSTIDDTREDAVVAAGASPEREAPVRDAGGFDACSPLTVDHSLDHEDAQENDDPEVNENLMSEEKLEATERQTATGRCSEVYEVPFDEDPMMSAVLLKASPTNKAAPEASRITTEVTPQESITEIPSDDKDTSSSESNIAAATSHGNLDISTDKVVASQEEDTGDKVVVSTADTDKSDGTNPASDNTPDAAVTAIEDAVSKAISASSVASCSLLDQEDEAEILPSPTDEQELRSTTTTDLPTTVAADSDEIRNNVAKFLAVEAMGCPDEICNQVSKFLALD